jgi:hypothetical protein
VHVDIWYNKLKEGKPCEDLEVDERVVLKLILKEVITVWAGFM